MKRLFLLLGALGVTGMLLAVFADVGVTLLAILNSLRILSHKDE
jgi:Cd2+/Zn2+-exporting ATPase